MKRILGLDLGTNSIGWALISTYFDKNQYLEITNFDNKMPATEAAG